MKDEVVKNKFSKNPDYDEYASLKNNEINKNLNSSKDCDYSTFNAENSLILTENTSYFDLFKGFFFVFISCLFKSFFSLCCKILLENNKTITSFHLLAYKVYIMLVITVIISIFILYVYYIKHYNKHKIDACKFINYYENNPLYHNYNLSETYDGNSNRNDHTRCCGENQNNQGNNNITYNYNNNALRDINNNNQQELKLNYTENINNNKHSIRSSSHTNNENKQNQSCCKNDYNTHDSNFSISDELCSQSQVNNDNNYNKNNGKTELNKNKLDLIISNKSFFDQENKHSSENANRIDKTDLIPNSGLLLNKNIDENNKAEKNNFSNNGDKNKSNNNFNFNERQKSNYYELSDSMILILAKQNYRTNNHVNNKNNNNNANINHINSLEHSTQQEKIGSYKITKPEAKLENEKESHNKLDNNSEKLKQKPNFLIANLFYMEDSDRLVFDLKRKDLIFVILRSLFAVLSVSLGTFALQHLSISNYFSVYYVYPAVVILLSFIILKEKVNELDYICLVSCFIGMIFIIRPEFIFKHHSDISNKNFYFIVILSAIFKSFEDIIIRNIGKEIHFLIIPFIYSIVGIILYPFILILAADSIGKPHLGLIDLFLLFLIALFSFLYQSFMALGIQNEKAGRASMINYLQIPFMFILDLILFNKPLIFFDVIGTFIIFIFNFGNGFFVVRQRNNTLKKFKYQNHK